MKNKVNTEVVAFNDNVRTRSSGRNKEVVTTGLVMFRDGDEVSINPLTSHGEITLSCYLRLPKNEIDNLINGLRKLK